MPSLAAQAVKRVDTATGWLTIIVWMFIGGTAAGAWWQSLPWQVPAAAFIAFFGYGYLRAVYQEHAAVVGERNQEREVLQEANTELQSRVVDLENRPRTEAEELKHNCLQHGTALNQFTERWLAKYRKVEARESASLTKMQKLLRGRDISLILDTARREYEKNFRDRAMKLFELAEECGLAEPKWKQTAKNAGGSLERMQMVAERLIRIGREED